MSAERSALSFPLRWFRRLTDTQPFEVFLSLVCLVSGAPLLFNGPTPGTIEETLPGFLVTLWGIELVLGGGLTLAGLATRSVHTERLGLSLLAAASLVYAVVLVTVGWPDAIVAGGITAGFGFACTARFYSVGRTLTIRVIDEQEAGHERRH